MGKQIGFYMTEVDELNFVETIKTKLDAIVIPTFFLGEEPPKLKTLPIVEEAYDSNTSLAVFSGSIDSKLVVQLITTTGEYTLDFTRSESIKLSRSFLFPDGTLREGRLWYEHQTTQGRSKRKAFLTWAEAVFRYVRKNFHRDKERLSYIGPDALQKLGKGQLVLGW